MDDALLGLVPLRPTKSRALYTQIVGRGTRLYPGKDKLLLLDFLWQTEQHDLCRPCHLVATRAETAAGMTEIQEREAQAGTEQMDLLDLEQMANSEELRKRHEALAEKLKEQARKKARLIDPVLLGVVAAMIGPAAQLSAPTGILIGPGEAAQVLHRDDSIYPLAWPHDQVVLNTNFGPRAVTIEKVGMSVVDVDLNHPMAGKDLHFDIEIVDVREAQPVEIEHGHVHGDGGHQH